MPLRSERQVGLLERRRTVILQQTNVCRSLENSDVVRVDRKRRMLGCPGQNQILDHKLDVDDTARASLEIRRAGLALDSLPHLYHRRFQRFDVAGLTQ